MTAVETGITLCGTHLLIRQTSPGKPVMKCGNTRYAHIITIKANEISKRFTFYGSEVDYKNGKDRLTSNDLIYVLEGILGDAICGTYTREVFFAEFGYDNDKAYQSCKDILRRLGDMNINEYDIHDMEKEIVKPDDTKSNFINSVIKGDAIIEMEKLPEKSVDIIITSPPYNLNIKYSTHKDNMDREKYLNWLNNVFNEARRVLKDDGSLFLNVGASNKDPWVYMDVANALRTDYNMQNDIVWIKSVAIDNTTYGHFKPINSKRFLNHTYEHLFHFTKKCDVEIDKKAIGVPYMDKSNITRWKHTENADKRCKGNCWFIPYDTIRNKSEKGNHPATFPEKLARDCIMMHGYDSNTIVLDMFAGTGSTLVAAKELGAQYIGIDIDDAYIEYAEERLKQ